MSKFSLLEKFEKVKEYWDPKIVAEFNDQQMRIARLKGEFVWHSHDEEDEVFMVLEGDLKIELRDQVISMSAGEVFVVPRGVEHRPVAANEVKVLLIEPASTVNTGSMTSELTRSDLEKI
ncbi:MAG: cupin domain-containing protein [Planctomycetota bacterium]|nr:cupin domain-containing protein [Planctomycetota bacterium]